jgi:hypothetical protein
LTNLKGHGFDVKSITKEGYELSGKVARSYYYSATAEPFHPDANNPVIFKMWRNGPKEPLISGSKFYGIKPDGRPFTIDFAQQTKTEGTNFPGDIIVRVERPGNIPPGANFDWSYSIEAINGGILPTTDEFTYRAPDKEYQLKYEFKMSATNSNWRSEIKDQQFYFKSRSGNVCGTFVV